MTLAQPFAQHEPLLLGLDLGTTNAKAAAYTLQGQLVAARAVTYPTSYPRPGWAEQQPVDWIAALTAAIQRLCTELGSRKSDLVAMGLSAHGPGVVLVDAQGQPLLETSPTWQDTRCLAQGKWLIETVGLGWAGQGMPDNSFPPKLRWIVEHHPAVAKQARYALGIKDFLVHWLTGEFATEPTTTAGGLAWWEPVFAACDWPLARLPQILPSTALVGTVRPGLAATLGLPATLPVMMGVSDGAAAALSMGAIQPGDVALTLATAGVIRAVLPGPLAPQVRLDHHLFCWPYVGGQWMAGGQLKAATSALDWFAQSHSDQATLDALLAEATQSPVGSRGVTFLPYLMGRGSPQPDANATGAFLGLTLNTGRGDLARALLESVAYEFRTLLDELALDELAVLGQSSPALRINGGGTRSPLWRQILAAVLARPLVYYPADSTLGAALIAAVGSGQHSSLEAAIVQMVHCADTTVAAPEAIAHYADLYRHYQHCRHQFWP